MKNSKIILGSLVIVLFSMIIPARAQDDQSAKEGELAIMEKIIEKLFYKHYQELIDGHAAKPEVSGNYLPDVGYIFTLPRFQVYYYPDSQSGDQYSKNIGNTVIVGLNLVSQEEAEDLAENESEWFEKEIKYFVSNYLELVDKLGENDKIMLVYGSLSEKSKNHNITNPLVQSIFKGNGIQTLEDLPELSAIIKYEDVAKYKEGKITDSELIDRINFNSRNEQVTLSTEFVIFADILEERYRKEHSLFYGKNNVTYKRIADMGVIYEIDLGYPLAKATGFTYNIRSTDSLGSEARYFSVNGKKVKATKGAVVIVDGQRLTPIGSGSNGESDDESEVEITDLNDEEKDKVAQAVGGVKVQSFPGNEDAKPWGYVLQSYKNSWISEYGEIKDQLKEDMIKYGKTLNSLEEDETLIVKADFSSCVGCGTPTSLTLSVSGKILRDYSARKITLEEGIKKINVTEYRPTSAARTIRQN